jgi:hypothetical protein
MRASDMDRHTTVLVLQDAIARGLLTPDEGGERIAVAFAAVHLPDLTPPAGANREQQATRMASLVDHGPRTIAVLLP